MMYCSGFKTTYNCDSSEHREDVFEEKPPGERFKLIRYSVCVLGNLSTLHVHMNL